MKNQYILFTLLATISSVSFGAAQVVSGKINSLTTYSTYGNGDAIFSMDTLPASCNGGFWLRKDDPGFSSNLSIVLSAFHGNTTIKVAGYDNELWPASSSANFCRITWMTLEK